MATRISILRTPSMTRAACLALAVLLLAPAVVTLATAVEGSPPQPPHSLVAAGGASPGSVHLTWAAQADDAFRATGFHVYRADGPDAPLEPLANVTDPSFDDTGLVPGRSYAYAVSSTNDFGESERTASESVTATPAPEVPPPAAPESVTAARGPGTGDVTISWTAVQGAESYRVTRLTPPETSDVVGTTNETQLVDEGLAPGAYSWEVVALAGGQESGPGSSESVTVPPPPPVDFTATPGPGAGEVTLSWSAPLGFAATGYHLARAEGEASFDKPTDVGDATGFDDLGLTPGATYRYQLTATTDAGESDPATATAHAGNPPGAPVNLTLVRGPHLGAATLSWEAPADGGAPEGYAVHRAPHVERNPEGFFALFAQQEPTSTDVGNVTTFEDVDLTPGATYDWWVSANGPDGEGPAGETVTGVTAGFPAAPENATATLNEEPGSVHLSWDAPLDDGGSPVLGYNVSETGGDSVIFLTSVEGLSADVAAPTDGATHTYQVFAVTALGEGDAATASADAVWPPAAPRGVWTTPGAIQGEVTLAWLPPGSDHGAPVTEYHVWRDGAPVGDTEGTTFTDVDLTPGSRHAYAISAANAAGEGPRSVEVSEIATPLPVECPLPTSVSLYECVATNFSFADLGGAALPARLVNRDDSVSGPFGIGFEFHFYGRNYTQVNVSSNGIITFGNPSGAARYIPDGIPAEYAPNAFIAAYWTDLFPTDGLEHVHYATLGEAPHRTFVVEWRDDPEYYYRTGNATFQIVLHEGSDLMEVQVLQASMVGHDATMGIEDSFGIRGVGVFHGPIPVVRQGFLFRPGTLPTHAPQALAAQPGPRAGQVNLSWSAPANVTDEHVFAYTLYRASGNGTPAALVTLPALAYVDTPPQPGVTYTYFVAGVNARGEGPWSAPASAQAATNGYAPTLVLDPAAPDGLDGWYVASPNATIALPASEERSPTRDVLEGNVTHASPFTVPEGIHSLVAHARDGAGAEGFSEPAVVRVDTTAPTATASHASDGRGVSARFVFSEPMSQESVAAALAAPAGWSVAWSKDGTVLFVNGTDVADGAYALALNATARDAHGVHLAAPVAESFTFAGPAPPAPPPPPPRPFVPRAPSAPTGLAAALHDGVVSLSWGVPEDGGTSPITGYRVYRAVDGGAETLLGSASGLSLSDAGVGPGHAYAYAVSALSGAGEGPRASGASASVPALPAPTSSATVTPAAPDGAEGWTLSAPRVELGASSPGATVLWHLDGGADQNYTSPISVPLGHHALHWHATQPGSAAEAEQTREFLVDLAPPALDSASLSSSSGAVGDSVVVTVRAHDDASGVASVLATLPDGTSVALSPVGGAFTGTLSPHAPGAFPIGVVARDHAGRETRGSAGTFTLAAPPAPAANATAPTNATNASATGGAGPAPGGPTPSGGSPGSSGSSGGAPLESASVTPTPTSPSSSSASPPPPAPAVLVTQDANETASLDAGARGQVHVSVQNAPRPDRIRFVVVDESGNEMPLGSGTDATWDTTARDDGYYSVEARETQPDGTEVTLASARVLVRNAHASAASAAGGVALGVGAAALATVATNTLTTGAMGAATASASSAASSAAGSAASTSGGQGFNLAQYLKDLFTDAGSDALRDKTKNVASIERRRKIASAIALVLTVGLIAVFYSVAEAGSYTWTAFVATLPFVGVAAVILALQKYGSESLIAHLSGARVRFRIWVAGVASLLVSTIAFRSPFGYPGYVDNGVEETESEKRLAGHRALAILGITSAWSLVFVLAGHLGFYTLGSVGVAMAVSALATAAMPFGPLPGGEVWRWSKPVSLGAAVAAMALYVTYEMALLPETALVAVGLVGAAGYAFTAVRFRSARRPPRRVPVEDVDAKRSAERAQKGEARREA